MKFISTIKSFFTPADGSSRRSSRTYVVDGARLVDEKTGRRMAPREQVQLLNSLAKVAKQEGLNIQVMFESDRPLREVENGGEFNGLKVFFAPDTEQLVAQALKLCRKGGNVLVSSGVTLESRATEAGITVLSSSTFRKAFLQGGGMEAPHSGGGRNDRGDRRRGGHDRKRSRNGNGGSRSARENAGPDSGAEDVGQDAAPPSGQDENHAVRNLIDLVE
jgi:hypothetical protein